MEAPGQRIGASSSYGFPCQLQREKGNPSGCMDHTNVPKCVLQDLLQKQRPEALGQNRMLAPCGRSAVLPSLQLASSKNTFRLVGQLLCFVSPERILTNYKFICIENHLLKMQIPVKNVKKISCSYFGVSHFITSLQTAIQFLGTKQESKQKLGSLEASGAS